MRSPARQKTVSEAPISSAIAASADALKQTKIGPEIQSLDLDMICTLVSGTAWNKIGFHARLAFAMLRGETKGVDIVKTVAELLDEADSVPPYEDTLSQIGQTRIALLEVAAMMKLSLRKQWKAVDAYLLAKGLPPMRADDELCDDDELLALRPSFEAGRVRMKAATEAVAIAERRYSEKDRRRKSAYSDQRAAIDADIGVVGRVAALKARTKEGIRFKQEVREYWAECQQTELDASIFADLLAYVEASP